MLLWIALVISPCNLIHVLGIYPVNQLMIPTQNNNNWHGPAYLPWQLVTSSQKYQSACFCQQSQYAIWCCMILCNVVRCQKYQPKKNNVKHWLCSLFENMKHCWNIIVTSSSCQTVQNFSILNKGTDFHLRWFSDETHYDSIQNSNSYYDVNDISM